jgi:TolA-binding protein
MLITGGLIVIGVLILVAVFFVSRGDATATRASSTGSVPVTPGAAPEAVPVATVEPSKGLESVLQKTPAPRTQPLPMNGQLHEMADQLQNLQQQSQELAQRLEMLNTMVRRIEQSESL